MRQTAQAVGPEPEILERTLFGPPHGESDEDDAAD